jgi:hypothetical protein
MNPKPPTFVCPRCQNRGWYYRVEPDGMARNQLCDLSHEPEKPMPWDLSISDRARAFFIRVTDALLDFARHWSRFFAREATRFYWSFLAAWHSWRIHSLRGNRERQKPHFRALITCHNRASKATCIRIPNPSEEL